MAKHYDKQFKLDAVQYYHDHKNLGLQGCATNLGISQQTLSRWQKELRETGDIESRGSGNYASDEEKIMASGFDGYTAKPINANLLRSKIIALLEKHLILL